MKHGEEAFLKLSFSSLEEEVHHSGSCHGNPLLSSIASTSVFCDENEISEYPHLIKSPHMTRRIFLDSNDEIHNHHRF